MTGAGRLLALALLAATLPGCAAARRPMLHRVTIEQLQYRPAVVSAALGDTVEWLNRDIVPHTATALDRRWDTGDIQPGARGRVVIRERGAQAYGCQYHPEMKGRVDAS